MCSEHRCSASQRGLDGSLLVADAGSGIVKLKRGGGDLFAPLPGVTDVAPTLFGMFAITGGTGPEQPQTATSEAQGLLMPMAATVDFRGRVNVVTKALIPGEAEVMRLKRR